jgi:glycosyltransferase involved in cell wall biosynthesis
MRRLLWIGDATCDSGFARCTHKTLEGLRKRFDVAVLGLNYYGDPHNFPYLIYPAFRPGGEYFGLHRVSEIVGKFKPGVVVLQNDPWNIPNYMRRLEAAGYDGYTVGALAVDGLNCRGRLLNKLSRVIFWTEFARREAVKGGLTRPSGVVGLGVDLVIYRPGDREEARRRLGLGPVPLNAFIVGNVNRNQPRKRLDLTIAYFAAWVHKYEIADAYLYLHICPTGEDAFDINQLAEYYGLTGRIILVDPDVLNGVSEYHLAVTYQSFDALLSTAQGEGWGLTAMEAMAAQIACVLPDNSAFGEWARNAALLVPCTGICVTPNRINSVGAVPSEAGVIDALNALYRDRKLRDDYAARGRALVQQDCFRWENIAERFADEVEKVYV